MPYSDVDQELESAAKAGSAAKVSELLAEGADPMRESSSALRWAARNGHAECVRLLLPVSDPRARDSYALRAAAWNGHVECVRLLLPVSEAKAEDCHAIELAARSGQAECVRLLLPVSGPLCEINGLLEKVLVSGQAKVAALLIEEEPRLVDGVDLSKCLAVALENGHEDMAGLLSSIIDKRELMDVAPDAAACGGRWHARL